MRSGPAWDDVCLLNLSSRGALAQTAEPPPQGTYIEMRRGTHVIVGRVVWREMDRFGVCTQDTINVEEIISEPNGRATCKQRTEARDQPDRRAAPRKPTAGERHEQSRIVARFIEYSFFLGATMLFAIMTVSVLQSAMARPMSQISAALSLR